MGKSKSQNRDALNLQVVHPDAAGIDIGNAEHYVAVPADRDAEPVRSFGCFTEDLKKMADWLTQCRIATVALQSTGVYWLPVYEVLCRTRYSGVFSERQAHEEPAGT
jgi:hypothetical protein